MSYLCYYDVYRLFFGDTTKKKTMRRLGVSFKFHVVVRSVLGESTDAVGDMDIIIDSITKNGKDHYRIWVGNGYNNAVWYIRELDETFYLDYLEILPFSVYTTVYGHDEKR